jgi:large subunit ribosomal protein L9
MQQADRISVKATERRAALNAELSDIAEVLTGKTLTYAVKAGETGRLYGSVSDEDIIDTIEANYEIKLEKRQVETEPIRQLGTYTVPIHFTMDLVPEITIVVHREGEPAFEEETEEADVIETSEETVIQEGEEITETQDEELLEKDLVEESEV